MAPPLVTACNGSMNDQRAQGFFVRDTRLISYYEFLNRNPRTLLASSAITHRVAFLSITIPNFSRVRNAARQLFDYYRATRHVGGMHEVL